MAPRKIAVDPIITLLFLAVIAISSGCAGPDNIMAFVKPYQADITAENYALQPPDEIEVYCDKVPQIHLQKQMIRPDGMVSFEGLGQLKVAGKTTSQVADMVREKASNLYTLPGDNPIDVRITAFRSKVYYVVGEVGYYGPKIYTGRDTLLRAVTTAQPQVTGWVSKIKVIRPSANKVQKPQIFTFNLKKVLKTGDISRDVLLQEGDIVYIPPTPLAAVAMVIEEFVRPIGRALSPAYQVYQIQNLTQ